MRNTDALLVHLCMCENSQVRQFQELIPLVEFSYPLRASGLSPHETQFHTVHKTPKINHANKFHVWISERRSFQNRSVIARSVDDKATLNISRFTNYKHLRFFFFPTAIGLVFFLFSIITLSPLSCLLQNLEGVTIFSQSRHYLFFVFIYIHVRIYVYSIYIYIRLM